MKATDPDGDTLEVFDYMGQRYLVTILYSAKAFSDPLSPAPVTLIEVLSDPAPVAKEVEIDDHLNSWLQEVFGEQA